MNRQYICIDLKSFYASVECVERGLDPLDTNLVVADKSRTEKTICLAVSPSLKKYKIPGRARLFEVIQKVKNVNSERRRRAKGYKFDGKSYISSELDRQMNLELDYIVAPPQMALYMEYSTRIYSIYLEFVAPEDIHVYSVDEVFMDVTKYLNTYGLTARELALKIVREVLNRTGITATAGIGTNMYLAKVAMDIEAKKMPPDSNGVRIAELDEMTYRQKLWSHRPITDFWRVGAGYSKKLEANGMFTMGDIARRSVTDEDKLYKLFGINAELLIDHAWGWEPCTIDMVKAYRPMTNSISQGQVLKSPYNFEMGKIIIKEMTDNLVFDLLDKQLVTDQIVLTIGYDIKNLQSAQIEYSGEITTDRYGRSVPKHAHGTATLKSHTSSAILITEATLKLYDRIVNPSLFIRRLNITANHVIDERKADENQNFEQLDFFEDYGNKCDDKSLELDKEKRIRQAMLDIKKQFGKNSILKGTSLKEGATAMERNNQIGGHKA